MEKDIVVNTPRCPHCTGKLRYYTSYDIQFNMTDVLIKCNYCDYEKIEKMQGDQRGLFMFCLNDY
jgi:glutaredoxin